MATKIESKNVTSNNDFLSAQEQAICMKIANSDTPHSQRALALLALNEGNTQGQAAEKTGLSLGQVKYLTGKFRKDRLGIFPEALLGELNTESDTKNPTKSEAGKNSVVEKGDAAQGQSTSANAEKKKKAKKEEKKSSKKAGKPKKEKKGKKTEKGKKKTGKHKKSKKSK